MSTSFPSGTQTFTNPNPSDFLSSPSHSTLHTNIQDTLGAVQAKVGIDNSTVTTSQDYILRNRLPVYNVKNYGAIGDGTTNDNAAVQAAIDAAHAVGGGKVFLPYGTYGVTGLTTYDKVDIIGEGEGISTLKCLSASMSNDLIRQTSGSYFTYSDFSVDWNNATPAASQSVFSFGSCSNFLLTRIRVYHIGLFGLGINDSTDFEVSYINFEKDTALNTPSACISLSSSVTGNKRGMIYKCHSTNLSMDLDGEFITVEKNYVYNHKVGGGITTEQSAFSSSYKILDNTIDTSSGTDYASVNPIGIENWGARSIIKGNMCYGNSGSGIDHGGVGGIVADNICINNGIVGGDGIVARYADATYNASYTVFVGNNCYDTSGTAGTQGYGYNEGSSALANIVLRSNNFKTNKNGETNILSASTYVGKLA